MKITRQQLRKLINESMDIVSPTASMFLEEISATFYSGAGRGVFHEKFPNNCVVRFVIFATGGDTIYISDIETRGRGCLRKGYGRKVMNTLVAKADMFGIILELDVSPYSESITLDDLYGFYASLGFKPAGVNDHPYRMRRLPE